METLFVISAGIDYCGSSVLRAYKERVDADIFANTCRLYQATRPITFGDNAEIEEIEAWQFEDEKWKKNHPGGVSACGAEYFSVSEVPFFASASDCEAG